MSHIKQQVRLDFVVWPSSSLPVPSAMTSASCGFSFAVSGRKMPPAVFSSLLERFTSTRRPRVVIEVAIVVLFLLCGFVVSVSVCLENPPGLRPRLPIGEEGRGSQPGGKMG